MIQYLLAVTICWAVFLVAYKGIFQKVTFFQYNRIYLVSSFLGGLLIPLIAKLFYVSETINLARSFVLPEIFLPGDSQQVLLESGSQVNLSWLWMIYLTGAIITLAKLIYGLFKIYTYYRNGVKVKNEFFTRVNTNKIHPPFSFFKCVFISSKLPVNDKINQILKHETAHINQWHSLDILLIELIQIILWFHPLVYFYKQAIKQSHEFYADAYATQDASKDDYRALLAEHSPTALEINLSNQFFSSKIKKRLVMIQKTKTSRNFILLYLLSIPILGILMLSFMKSDQSKPIDYISEKVTTPIFPGCEDTPAEENCTNKSLVSYVYSNLEYPKEAQSAKIEGKSITEFYVDEKGEIGSIKVLNDIGGGTSNEIRRVLLSMNDMPSKWIPGQKDGKAVSVRMTLPVIFKLADPEISLVAKGNPIEGNWKLDPQKKVEEKSDPEIALASDGNPIDGNWKLVPAGMEEKKNENANPNVFFVVDQMPSFPGCKNMKADASNEEIEECHKTELLKYVYSHVKYPKIARKEGIEGMSVVQFIVSSEGKVEDIAIVRKVHESIDLEVIRMLDEMAKEVTWIPGMHDGKKVNVKYTLPVKFKLEGDGTDVPPKPPVPPSMKNIPPPPPPPISPPALSLTDIERLSLDGMEFTLSPNPTQSELKITTKDIYDGNTQVIIYDIKGNTVKSVKLKSKETMLNIGSLSPGNYVIVLQNSTNNIAKNFVKM